MRSKSAQYGPYTDKEVEAELQESYRRDVAMKFERLEERAINWRGTMLGFKFWGHFVKLETGWYASFEDICPYCLRNVVLHHGTRDERLQWLAANETGEDRIDGRLYPMPITKKDWATYKAAERRKRKRRKRELAAKWGQQPSRAHKGRRYTQRLPPPPLSPAQEFIEIDDQR